MQTLFAASMDMTQTTASFAPSPSSASTGTKQDFASHLQHAAGKQTPAHQSTGARNSVLSDQAQQTGVETKQAPERATKTGQQSPAEDHEFNQAESSEGIATSSNMANADALSLSVQTAGPSPVTDEVKVTGRSSGSGTQQGATVLQMLNSITAMTEGNGEGNTDAVPTSEAQSRTNGLPLQQANNGNQTWLGNANEQAQLGTSIEQNQQMPDVRQVRIMTPGSATFSPVMAAAQSAPTMADDSTLTVTDKGLSFPQDVGIIVHSSGDNRAVGSSSSTATTIVYNPTDNSVTTPVDKAASLVAEMNGDPEAPFVVQNKYGQIITIQYSNTPPVISAASGMASSHRPQAVANSSTRDLADEYIHSRLPTDAASRADGSSNASAVIAPHSQSTFLDNSSQNFDERTVSEPLPMTKGLNTNDVEPLPFFFSPQQGRSQGETTASTTTTSMYRLPSGNFVPDGTVTDQMIAHFSVNRRLESGSINLKLYPQELGELRMEIKVEQDNVKAHIIAQSPQTQEMIDRHMPKLREALEQQGLHLQQVEVTVAAQDNASGERFQDSRAWQQAGRSTASQSSQTLFEHQLEEELDGEEQSNSNLSVIA
jgi:flagellar hook-length control protein FliK